MKKEYGLTIKQAAEQTGIAEDNIRYYEKIALLPRAERKNNGHRIYRENDVQRIQLISCLKKTGLSLEDMRPFLIISANTDLGDYPELVERFKKHRENIVSQIAALQQVVNFVDRKLEESQHRLDCPNLQQSDSAPGTTEDAKEKFISSVQINYFPASVSIGKQ